ncbi:hypothetical protein [Ferrimicrobium sp.]|uniref:hypothetical protein n=1 Tax=Ferrimicrobium sp. TaxID=2926050 RepID=UPI00262CBFAC|nr:hypothetical protein [Ferrimicrobium sp.]
MAILFSRDVVEFVNGTWEPPVRLSLGHILTGLGCASGGSCVAIDGLGDAYLFNGHSWSNALNAWGSAQAVSCESSQFCFAAGGGVSQWDGISWSEPADVDPGATMTAIDCASPENCVVVDDKGRLIRWEVDHWTPPTKVTSDAFAGVATLSDRIYVLVTGSGGLYTLGPAGLGKLGLVMGISGRVTGLACASQGSVATCYLTTSRGDLYQQRIPVSSVS